MYTSLISGYGSINLEHCQNPFSPYSLFSVCNMWLLKVPIISLIPIFPNSVRVNQITTKPGLWAFWGLQAGEPMAWLVIQPCTTMRNKKHTQMNSLPKLRCQLSILPKLAGNYLTIVQEVEKIPGTACNKWQRPSWQSQEINDFRIKTTCFHKVFGYFSKC